MPIANYGLGTSCLGLILQPTRLWDILMESDFMDRRDSTSMHTLQGTGERLRRKKLGYELDLYVFRSTVIDNSVNLMVERIPEPPTLSQSPDCRVRCGLRTTATRLAHTISVQMCSG